VEKPFVVFRCRYAKYLLNDRHGTCVLVNPSLKGKHIQVQKVATQLMKKYGPVHVGSSAGDFGVSNFITLFTFPDLYATVSTRVDHWRTLSGNVH
jgi:hypothetical protein